MEKLHLPIIIEMDEDGYYIVSCPLFKSCHSYGETIDEAMANIKEVIEMCLEETKPDDLKAIQQKATEAGISYQTLIANIVHGFVSGNLVEKSQ